MSDDASPEPPSLFEQAVAATAQVENGLTEAWSKTPELEFLFDVLGGMVYHAAQKLIEMKKMGEQPNAVDEATIISCSRLFNACFSGYTLLRRGLVLDSLVLLRTAYESTTQVDAFFKKSGLAQQWLNGSEIPPREVRRVSAFAASSRSLYKRLSGMTHANVAAAFYHVTTVDAGAALAYGGSYQPKAVGQVACQLLWAEFTLLDMFYSRNAERLAKFNLLWKSETLEKLGASGSDPAQALAGGWETILAPVRAMLEQLTERFNALPDDADLIASEINRRLAGE